ncbi:hypothetical protein FACS18948_1080 [Clostridia bacterium]|nr:hypothetical protein FACS18948_1080 [Clostridia bacterium]
MNDWNIGALSAAPGTKTRGFLPVPGTPVQMPITLINGVKSGKTAVITGGTHGGEYVGIETSIRLAQNLTPDQVSGRIAIVHPVNTPAFFAKLQYVGPYDGLNLNREYPGKATGTVSQRIAHTISSKLFSQADVYFDLHGGDLHEALTPFVIVSTLGSKEQNAFSLTLAKALGIKYICLSASANGTFGCAAEMGVAGFLGEIGGCGLWDETSVGVYYEGVANSLRAAGILAGEVSDNPCAITLEKMIGLNSAHEGCWYPAVSIDSSVAKGQKLGEVRDCFGQILEEVFASEDGPILYVASSLSVCVGDPLAAIGKPAI